MQFQAHFEKYRIVFYESLRCDQIMFDGNTQLNKRLNLPFDHVTKHYNVINSLTGAMAKNTVVRHVTRAATWM
jgi:hypothetical protein